MQIPFTNVDVHLKQVRFEDLHEVEKKTLSFFFPGYASKGFSLNEIASGMLKPRQEEGSTVSQDDTMPRRFAGDLTLPRSRYHTVCRDETGDDGGTLLKELRAYSKPEECGYVLTIDSTGTDSEAEKVRSMLQPHVKAIFCIPQDIPRFPSFYGALVGLNRHQPTGLIGVIPLTVTRQTIDKVIDLRRPEVQTWFTTTLTRLHDPATRKACFPVAGPLTDFTRLLPALLSQGLGDPRRVTQIAGVWLRNIGTNAVIFPSARSNAMTRFVDGKLVDFAGWNLVDYRQTPKPQISSAIDLSPEWESYPQQSSSLPQTEGEKAPTIVYDRTRISQNIDGPDKGSLTIEGIAEQRETFYQVGVWMHFARRISATFPNLEIPRLHQLMMDISTGPSGLETGRLALLASFCYGALFAAPQSRQALLDLGRQLEGRNEKERAGLISRYVAFCDSLGTPRPPLN